MEHELSRHYPILRRSHLRVQWLRRITEPLGINQHNVAAALLDNRLRTARLRYVSGHYRVSLELLRRYKEQWNFLTVLREPIERWYSNYFFNREKRSSHYRISAPLDAYSKSRSGKIMGCAYLRIFGGWQWGQDPELAVDRAKRTLDEFRFVGSVEQLDVLRASLERELGIEISIPRRNQNPVRNDRQVAEITPQIRRRVEAACKHDLEVYRYALALGSR